MDLRDLRTLLDYHYWARDRILDSTASLTPEQFTRDLGGSFRSVRDTLVHIYSAEWNWRSRCEGIFPTAMLSPDDYPDLATLRVAWVEHETKMRALLDSLGEEGISRVFKYTMFDGRATQSVFWQILQHVVNHATYHRGQVATMLRQLGAKGASSMDLIAFYRLQD